MDMEWERVSWRRYAAHFSLCVLTVYISNLITETPFPTAMIWGSAPYIGLIVSLATQFGPPGVPASQMYCSITAVMLLYLDKAATALGKAAEPSFDNTGIQQHAVHFALAFFVLSELEYRRQYIVAKGMEHFRNYPLDLLLADIDLTLMSLAIQVYTGMRHFMTTRVNPNDSKEGPIYTLSLRSWIFTHFL